MAKKLLVNIWVSGHLFFFKASLRVHTEITVGGFEELKSILFYIFNSSISPLQLYNHDLNHI